MKSLVFWGVAPAVLAAVCGSACSVRADEVRIVAKPGDSVRLPGDTNRYTISRLVNASNALAIPSASDMGTVVFLGQIAGPGITVSNNQCVLRATRSGDAFSVDSIARRGASAPVSSSFVSTNATFSTLGAPTINDYGCIFFQGSITGTNIVAGQNSSGFWGAGPTSSIFAMLQDRMDAPTTVGGDIATFSDVVMAKASQSLQLTFGSSVVGAPAGSPTRLLGRSVAGQAALLAAPTVETTYGSGVAFATDVQRVQGESGAAAVYGSLMGTSVGPTNNQCVWSAPRADVQSLIQLARTGSAAAGMSGWNYAALLGNAGAKPVVTSDGAVVFAGRVSNAAGNVDYGMWIGGPGFATPMLLARGSQSAPGAGAGATLGVLFAPTGARSMFGGDADSGGARNPLAFASNMVGGSVSSYNNRALWRMPAAAGATPVMLARGGAQAPDAEPGTSFVNSTLGYNMIGNHRGDFAVFAQLQGADVTDANDYAYYISRGNALHLVAREGDEVPGTGGLRIVSMNIQPQMYLNDLGQLVFYAFVSPDGTANGAQFAFIGADETGGLRILATPGQVLHPTNGPDCMLGGLSLNATSCLTNTGDFVFGGVVTGTPGVTEAVFSIHLTAVSTTPPCPADWNHNGVVSEQDLYDFLGDYFAGQGDFNRDGVTNLMDLFGYLADWYPGC